MKKALTRGKENKTYLVMLVIGVLLFGVFFTSESWMYDDTVIAQTPFHESIGGLNQTTIVLRNWEYNPDNNLMEVTIETMHTGTDAVEPTFSFVSEGKDTGKTYPAHKVFKSDNKMVIQIENVPDDYRVIGLFITEHRDEEILKQAYKEQLNHDNNVATTEDGKIDESELPEPEEIILVGDYRKISINKSLVTQTDKAYKKETIRSEMERIQNQMKTLVEDRIPFQKELISTLKKEKGSFQREMKFETKEEKLETEKEIQQKENAIQDTKEEIQKHQEKIKELRQKYQNREDKLNALTVTKEEKEQQRESNNDDSKTQSNNKNASNDGTNKNEKTSNNDSNNKENSSSKRDNRDDKNDSDKKKSKSKKKDDSSSQNDNKAKNKDNKKH
ncbi:hypothetical protein [Virgibacillus ihumii]|uniref:hypothetical protein n=1 Tax=Virgibacillus ihumii TaxID=2686091 RepID=UPI00157BE4A6|nr:hypothetical protein [Virgibacillus ihumii]